MPPDLQEIRRWLEKADHDRRMADVGLEQTPPITDAAAFHCQQAVEKLLKAYLVSQGHEFERIHDLEALTNECSQYDSAFAPLRIRVAPLTPFAVRFRYPGPADPSPEQVRKALEVVAEVWEFVAKRLPPTAVP